jgi:hypothetical protein
MRDRRRLQRDQVVGAGRLHLQMLAAVVDEHRYAPIGQHVTIEFAKVPGVPQHVFRELGDVDAANRRMERRRVRRVPHAEPDDEDVLRP